MSRDAFVELARNCGMAIFLTSDNSNPVLVLGALAFEDCQSRLPTAL